MELDIKKVKKNPVVKEMFVYNEDTGNRIDVYVYLSPLKAIYKVGKEGDATAKLFLNLKSAVDMFNKLECKG